MRSKVLTKFDYPYHVTCIIISQYHWSVFLTWLLCSSPNLLSFKQAGFRPYLKLVYPAPSFCGEILKNISAIYFYSRSFNMVILFSPGQLILLKSCGWKQISRYCPEILTALSYEPQNKLTSTPYKSACFISTEYRC